MGHGGSWGSEDRHRAAVAPGRPAPFASSHGWDSGVELSRVDRRIELRKPGPRTRAREEYHGVQALTFAAGDPGHR